MLNNTEKTKLLKNYNDFQCYFKIANSNKRDVAELRDLLSTQRNDLKDFCLLIEVDDSIFVSAITVCSCGHVHFYNTNEKIVECPNCKRPISDSFTNIFTIENRNKYHLNDIIQCKWDNNNLEFNVFALNVSLKYDGVVFTLEDCSTFAISKNEVLEPIYEDDEGNTDYLPLSSDIEVDEYVYTNYDGQLQTFGLKLKDLFESIFDFNPKFKEFMEDIEVNSNYSNYYKNYIKNSYNHLNIPLLLNYYQIFCKIKMLSKFPKKKKNEICDYILYKENDSASLYEYNDALLNYYNNANIVNYISQCFNIDSINVLEIDKYIKFFKEILTVKDLINYVISQLQIMSDNSREDNLSKLNVCSLINIRPEYQQYPIEKFIKYIFIGSNNEDVEIYKLCDEIKNLSLDMNLGVFKRKYINRNRLDKYNHKCVELLDKCANANSFDNVYKIIMNS